MLRTLALLVTVAQTTARANNAPVCAIGLKKGARVRLPQGARKASPALQIRVRKQLPIPIIPGAHVATLKNCHKDVGAFRQTWPASRPRKKIAKTFPSFDERIGWSIHGAYDDEGLPVEVEERLSAFFRPHDDAFFEILGRRLAWRT